MNKWNVLIVDDEFRIGMLVNKLINWDELGLRCAAVVDNGQKALSIMEKERIDILITDIRMPKINGLDLINLAAKHNSNMKCVVISGYKEFEYAYKALKFGVYDYLLKPIGKESINRVLENIVAELSKEKSEQEEEKMIKKTIHQSKQIIKENLMKTILDEKEKLRHSEYKEVLDGEFYQAINVKLDYSDYNMRDKLQDDGTILKITSLMETALDDLTTGLLICEKEFLNVFCVFSFNKEKEQLIKNAVNSGLFKFKEELMGFENYEITIGVGKKKEQFGDIRYSIMEAQIAIQNRIRLGTGRLINAEHIADLKTNEKFKIEDYTREMASCIESYSKDKAKITIKKIFMQLSEISDIDCGCYYTAAEWLTAFLLDNISHYDENIQSIKKQIESYCNHCYTIQQLQDFVINTYFDCFEHCVNVIALEHTKPIREAKKYIEEHYYEKITLEDIAYIVNLNPVYFSVLFKKETGLNFSSYLAEIRIENAKKMICSSNETIAVIGERVGYKDYRYFSQIFTKSVGIKPALYRKLHS